MIIKEIIQSAEYIYSTYTKWGLKKFICDIEYYTEETLNDLFFVICSILDTNDGIYDKRELGLLLGLSMCNQTNNGKNETYFDIAEVRLFDDILAEVEKENLIRIAEHDVILTTLGKVSLKENKHFSFYKGKQFVYEHLKLKSETPTALLMFPFFKDMGIGSQITNSSRFWPNDEEVEDIIYYKKNQLIKRLENHSSEISHIYFAKQEDYFDIDSKRIQVNLYKGNEGYFPVIMNGENIAEKASNLILEPLNISRKEDLVQECLFQQLWDDKEAVLNYEALKPFIELVDFEELTKDNRTVWGDNNLFNIIKERSNQTCWRNISRFCTLDALYEHIEDIKDKLDWPIFTGRADDIFLTDNFLIYPWDLEILSEDNNREEKVLEKLILLQKETSDEWNWEYLEQRLSSDFVLQHLDIVRVNLSIYTEDNPDVRMAILSNIECRWDWDKIESSFDLQFILENISSLSDHFTYTYLFDRIFSDTLWSEKFVKNNDFKIALSNASKGNGSLSSCILNDREYIWTSSVIDLFSSLGLISWSSTPYMKGFECNPLLVWDKEFFSKYSNNVITEEGSIIVSKGINDFNILLENPLFAWSWDAISSNKALITNNDLFLNFGDRLNWVLIFEHQDDILFLQSIDDIESMIGENEEAWTMFSKLATLDYVKKQYKAKGFPWDWSVLTERMFKELKLENIGHPMFINKWDWNYLSEHIDKDFILNNLEKYSGYWCWDIVFNRILTPTNRLDYSFLDSIASILTNINGSKKCKDAWSALTRQYKFKELKKLIKDTVHKRLYWWDINYFCLHEEFDVFSDLQDFHNLVDWEAISSSPTVDKSLKFNPKLKIKPKAWNDDVIKILSDSQNRWNFKALSSFESLRDQRWFVSRFKKEIDWDFISRNSKIFAEEDKQKLNEVIESYKDYINFKALSERNDVNIEQVIKIYPKGDYDYNKLIERGVIKVTMSLVAEIPDYEWNLQLLTTSPSFIPKAAWLLENLSEDLNWEYITARENESAWSNEELLREMAVQKDISERVNWKFISEQKSFPLIKELLMILPFDKINWRNISQRKGIISLIEDFKYLLDWRILSANKHLDIRDISFLNQYKENLVWSIICNRTDFTFTNDILESFADYIDWDKASSSLDIMFSRSLVDKYQDRWNWPVLVKNRAFHNKVDISDMPYVKKINIIDFIEHFKPRKPLAYHFTHMSNALNIIRNMKLQSRNYAEGNFTNSAGSNVHRTAKAHRFARFYFAPKSPTQFYNECLGKDESDYKYYRKAINLGLPKCPLPVFFVFDIEELLMTIPDKCYYSNGNMQKDSSRSFKVIEEPNRIKAREIYINSWDTFDERQQEFLVEGELDFSKLNKIRICCYDDYQAKMLKKELSGSQWEDIISIDRSLYEHCNKELRYEESDESIRISTNNYRHPFEFKVVYASGVPTIINKNMVLRQRNNNIFLKDSVEINKDVPFEVYFETKEPRVESWLIFKN